MSRPNRAARCPVATKNEGSPAHVPPSGLETPRDEDLATTFHIDARSMGLRDGMDIDDITGLLDRLDGAARR